jgi:hypothetical protein
MVSMVVTLLLQIKTYFKFTGLKVGVVEVIQVEQGLLVLVQEAALEVKLQFHSQF